MKPARKSSNSSYLSIRSKLIAAVAMLLVASFMVVSYLQKSETANPTKFCGSCHIYERNRFI